jgi:hypothetical protein
MSKTLSFPTLTTAQRDALSVTAGTIIYNIDLNLPQFFNGSVWVNLGNTP